MRSADPAFIAALVAKFLRTVYPSATITPKFTTTGSEQIRLEIAPGQVFNVTITKARK